MTAMQDDASKLKALIAAAIESSKGDQKATAKAMKSIRWRIRNIMGLYVGLDGIESDLLPAGHKGIQTFDGRDNEDAKLAFMKKLHGSDLFIELAK